MKLVTPSEKYKDSFIRAISEYHSTDSRHRTHIHELKIKNLEKDFPRYIAKLLSQSLGKNLPPGYVPATTYWLIVDNEFIGSVNIRHILSENLSKVGGHIGYDIRPSRRKKGYGRKILKLALSKARELGLKKILITCDETNIASKKIIEANGGVFENRLEQGHGRPAKLRYWIDI